MKLHKPSSGKISKLCNFVGWDYDNAENPSCQTSETTACMYEWNFECRIVSRVFLDAISLCILSNRNTKLVALFLCQCLICRDGRFWIMYVSSSFGFFKLACPYPNPTQASANPNWPACPLWRNSPLHFVSELWSPDSIAVFAFKALRTDKFWQLRLICRRQITSIWPSWPPSAWPTCSDMKTQLWESCNWRQ